MIDKELINKYNLIKTPEELLEFMDNNINYGYLGKNNKVYYFGDVDFDKDWYNEYILESKDDILKTGIGNCFDQTELERCWFLENDYEIKTVFVMVNLDYENNYPTHAFLCYKNKDNNGWNYFENADFDNRGIHPFTSFNELIKYQLSKYKSFLGTFDIKEDELDKIVIKVFSKPNEHLSAKDYLDFVLSSIDMDI